MSIRTTLSRWWHTPKIRSWTITVALAGAGFNLALLWGAWHRACMANACPSVTSLDGFNPDQASKVFAADGRLITDLGGERRTVVPLDQMSPAVIAAFLSVEDKRFYSHHGIDWFRVVGTVKNYVLYGKKAGASTITMQLAGNVWQEIDRRDRSPRRKIREAQVALEIESRYSKDKILELYLNQIDLGNRAFGVEAAAQRYFGKSARDLNVAEAATLAAIPKSPTRYNPRRFQGRSVQRRNVVINLMRDNGVLTAEEAERWKAYPLALSSRSDFSEVAPYFTEYVRQLMSARFGPEVYTGGLRIYTTLDLEVQQAAERALEAQLQAIESGTIYGPYPHPTYAQYLQRRADNEDAEPPSSSPYLQGMVVSIDPRTGYIRAMVGGRDFEDSKFNRAVQARRQPGSTFKPFVYSAALRAGHPFSEILVDEPMSVPDMGPNQEPWEPQNYDLQFRGPLTLRQALTYSNNIVTIRLGMEELGENAVIDEATRFGITTPIRVVPSIHIGSAEVQPLELVSAYTAFANLGARATPTAILRVEDRDGNILWQPQARLTQVMPRNQAWLMVDVLRDIIRNPGGTAYAATTAQGLRIPAGGKTGTTDEGTDVWFVGFTPDLVTGFWMGLDLPQRIKNNAAGGLLAAPAWNAMMRDIYERRTLPPEPWPRPDSLVIAEIDRTTGQLAWPYCPRELHYVQSYLPGTEPKEYCRVHELNPLGGSGVFGAPPR
jgi:penicillin-binding protein 1A